MSATTKTCTKCFTEKPITEFGWKNRVLNRRHAVCKQCTAVRSNNWYYANKDAHIENVMAHKKEARNAARQYVWTYLLSHPCIKCGEADPIVLDFHHRHGKDRAVSRMIADGLAITTIQNEIEKCDVLCSNCHRRVTAEERGWFRGNT